MFKKILLLVVSVIVFGATGSQDSRFAAAQSGDPEYGAYDKGAELGLELFKRAYKDSGAKWRVAAVMRACEYGGLADSIENKESDSNFSKMIGQMIEEGLFNDVPSTTLLYAQQAANSLRTGYKLGYRQAAEALLDAKMKKGFCEAGIKQVDNLLK